MVVSLAALAVTGIGLIAFGARLGRRAFWVGALPLGAATAWVTAQLGGVIDGVPVSESLRWVSGLDLAVDLRLDGLAALMSLIIGAVGVAVLAYSTRYFAPDAPDLGRLAGLLVLFGGSMLGLVQADHLLVLYTCWELTAITSFLLIGNRHTESRARAAALHALLVTGAGGLVLLGGVVLLGREAGTYRISEILADPPPNSAALTVAMCLMLVGAFTKSAQYPFHAWLPGAMAAPTPVSAYLHSATMVKAGVVLVAMFAPMFSEADLWRPIVFTVGCCTLVFGGLRALRQHDLKLLLAFGTVSQLGLLMVLFGAGTAASATAGCVLLIAHAAFKAALFMVVGVIDHQTGTRDIRVIPALRDGWRPTEIVTVLTVASMIGVPLDAGFVAKELAYDSLDDARSPGAPSCWPSWSPGRCSPSPTASASTGARSSRRAAAASEPEAAVANGTSTCFRRARRDPRRRRCRHWNQAFGRLTGSSGRRSAASQVASSSVHLSLWHGVGLPLALSVVTLGAGLGVAVAHRRIEPLLARGGAIPSGAEVYRALLRVLGIVSVRVTRFVQNGSLPVYIGVIVAHSSGRCRRWALLVGGDWPGWPAFGALAEAPVVIVLLVAALGAAIVRRRFAAAVFLSVTGYAMAGLFVLSGAPDLALTQAAVETLSTVVFVLVLRRLPERFERQSSPRRRVVRLAVAAAVGVCVFVLRARRRWLPADPTGVRRDGGPIGARRPRSQRRQRDPRRLPRLRHPRRDHRPCGGVDRRRRARPGRAAGSGTAADARQVGRPDCAPARLRRRVCTRRLLRRADDVAVVALRRATTNRAAVSSAGCWPARRSPCATSPAASTRSAGTSRFRPWTVLGTGMLLAATTAVDPVARRRRRSRSRHRLARSPGARSRERELRARVRHRRLPRRRRHGADGLRVLRRRARRRQRRDRDAGRPSRPCSSAIGTYLLLQRKLSRIIIGLGLLTHGANILLITAGRRGEPADHRRRRGRCAVR